MTLSLTTIRDELGVCPGRLFIDGNWLSWDEHRFDQIHPATNEVMTHFAEAGAYGVDLEVAAARKAFDDGPWPRMPAQDRKRILQPIVERIYATEKTLAQLQTLDNGIPYTFSRNSRVSGKAVADIFDHYAGRSTRSTARRIHSSPVRRTCTTCRFASR